MSYGTCVILSGLAVRHPRRSVCLSPVSAVVREETSPAPRTRRCSGIAWYSDFVFPMVFVLAALTVVAAGSLGLLVRTSIVCIEKIAAAFTSFPVSLVGAVLRRSSSMLAIPFKGAF